MCFFEKVFFFFQGLFYSTMKFFPNKVIQNKLQRLHSTVSNSNLYYSIIKLLDLFPQIEAIFLNFLVGYKPF